MGSAVRGRRKTTDNESHQEWGVVEFEKNLLDDINSKAKIKSKEGYGVSKKNRQTDRLSMRERGTRVKTQFF